GEEVRNKAVRGVGQPEIAVTRADPDGGIAFTAEVDVRPEVTLPELASLAVAVDDAEGSDEELADRVGVLRDRVAMLRTAERPVQTGDYGTIHLSATVDEEEVESRTGLSYEVGSGHLVDGLDDALVGMEGDQEKSFGTKLAGGDLAGKVAEVVVTVRAVKEKELPELDDDFAQTA